jgi:hypothetical protein
MSFNCRWISCSEISRVMIKINIRKTKIEYMHLHETLCCIDSLDAACNFPFPRCKEIWSAGISLSEQCDVIVTIRCGNDVQISRGEVSFSGNCWRQRVNSLELFEQL